ncbi:MAG: hypothetical protein KGI67_03520 [Pseudomonadota bacterium]|nr:hypothetical protein [Pseudomonadota bacterium]
MAWREAVGAASAGLVGCIVAGRGGIGVDAGGAGARKAGAAGVLLAASMAWPPGAVARATGAVALLAVVAATGG